MLKLKILIILSSVLVCALAQPLKPPDIQIQSDISQQNRAERSVVLGRRASGKDDQSFTKPDSNQASTSGTSSASQEELRRAETILWRLKMTRDVPDWQPIFKFHLNYHRILPTSGLPHDLAQQFLERYPRYQREFAGWGRPQDLGFGSHLYNVVHMDMGRNRIRSMNTFVK